MNQLINSKTENAEPLEVAVRRARALLTEGDIDRARIVADSVYVRAKTEAEFARKHGAASLLIDKARRLMADALTIEATSLAALADRVDSQQAAGEVRKTGRARKDQTNGLKLSDIGISNRLLYQARRFRDAEIAQPGVIARTVEAQFASGHLPSRAAIIKRVRSKTDDSPVPALSTGINVARLHWYELEACIRQHEEALAALRRVFHHAVPADVDLRVRDVIGPRRLAALIAGEEV